MNAARQAIWAIDPHVGISAGGSIERALIDFYRSPEFDLFTLSAFAGIGLALIAVGIFSVMAYSVSLRTHEIGVRMALGAAAPRILLMVFARGLRLVTMGGALGLAAAYAFSSVLVSRMSGVSPTDPLTFAVVAAIVVLVGLGACLIPARQATRVDPSSALRCE
jgi:putative ABC transport system permease protein